MQCFTLFAVVAAACVLLDAGVAGYTVTTCGPVKYPNVHRLVCKTGVIQVTSSFFGRADGTTCISGVSPIPPTNMDCSLPVALSVVSKLCNGKDVCEINEKTFLVDPCSDTFKYMHTMYECIHPLEKERHLVTCEGSIAHLECGNLETINVSAADYGRKNNTICSFGRPMSELENIQCTNPTNVPASNCNGHVGVCKFMVDDALGAGCVGTSRYLDLTYTCI